MKLRIRLHLVATDKGGRRAPIWRMYRSSWETPDGSHHDAPIVDLSPDPLSPGNDGEADIYPLFPQYWDLVVVGDRLLMREGPRLVGQAEVLAIDSAWLPPAVG
jgi:hypothetical protein